MINIKADYITQLYIISGRADSRHKRLSTYRVVCKSDMIPTAILTALLDWLIDWGKSAFY